jgi:hypothetical protein
VRPDISRIEFKQTPDKMVVTKLFKLLRKCAGGVSEVAFHRYQWCLDERSEAAGRYLGKAAALERVELMNVQDSYKGVSAVMEGVVACRGLRALKMPREGVGYEQIMYIYKVIEESEALREIDMSEERVEEQREDKGSTKKLRRLKENYCVRAIEKMGVRAAEGRDGVRIIRMNGCELGRPGAKKLCRALLDGLQLQVLEVAENEFGEDGILDISKGLRLGYPPICELNFSKNPMSESGAKALSEALLSLAPTLTNLNLSHNHLHSEGFEPILSVLPVLTRLTTLGLGTNHLKDPSIELLCTQYLADSCPLEALDLSDNLLTSPTPLLDLLSPPTSADDDIEILSSVGDDDTRNQTLKSIDLRHNDFDQLQKRSFRQVEIARRFAMRIIT